MDNFDLRVIKRTSLFSSSSCPLYTLYNFYDGNIFHSN